MTGTDTLFTDSDVLQGGRCRSCACVTFPLQSTCPRCTEEDMSTVELPLEGELWTWTIQGFPPKSPPFAPGQVFSPYGVGYVDLGEVMVETRLTSADPECLEIGMRMRLVPKERRPDPWPWFEPVTEDNR